MRDLNRSAIVVTPKQPFLEWLHAVDLTSSGLTLQDLRQEPDVYLIPECESEEDFAVCLRELFPTVFAAQLEAWWTEPSSWPANPTSRLGLHTIMSPGCRSRAVSVPFVLRVMLRRGAAAQIWYA